MKNDHPAWHADNWQILMDCLHHGRMPHALLFAGTAGVGKNLFARRLSQTLLCEERDEAGNPCYRCQNCQLFAAENHPDYKQVNPLEDKKIIGVDQIREVSGFLNLKSQYGLYRCIQISPAEQLNENAANSLLKTLEEPPHGTVLMLITDKPGRLSATIRSRCHKVIFSPPDQQVANDWLAPRLSDGQDASVLLALSNNAPYAALELSQSELLAHRLPMLEDIEKIIAQQADPVEVAAKWLKLGAKESLYWLYSWLVDIARLRMTGDSPHLSNPDFRDPLSRLSKQIDIHSVFRNIEKTGKAINRLDRQVNQQLLLEDLLIAWQVQPR